MNRLFIVLPIIIQQFCIPFNQCKAQDDTTKTENIRNEAPRVYIDCFFCDFEYIKKEISYVNYVRSQEDAEIRILITKQSTGSGGTEFYIQMDGHYRFAFMNDILKYVSKPNSTEDEIRTGLTQILKLGLMQYIAKTPISQQVTINYADTVQKETTVVEDKWKSWIFELILGGWFNGEELYKMTNLWTVVSASKITPDWKSETRLVYDHYDTRYVVDDVTITSLKDYKYMNHQTVKSMGEHWSAGANISLNSSSYDNIEFGCDVLPAIEYNLFPYSESAKKQLRFLYRAGYRYFQYNDTTLFNKTEENLFGQNLEIALEIKELWGSASVSLMGYNYFHDFKKNRLMMYSSLRLKITKNLAFNLSGQVNIIHDQLSLPKAGATSEDILLRQRQLATQYSYNASIGLTYTFGAIYNNVVNPRFGL
ncbi:MAG: hypothetical protein KJ607_07520 [Bacteroidetes bacterium]|nr:hypothetical protein [Bacteroidota bacterium]